MSPSKNPTRIWHLFKRPDLKKIEAAISQAEQRTSAELRVALLHNLTQPDIRSEAVLQFQKLGMDQTREHSGVLILLAAKEKSFIVFADEGINERVDEGSWDEVKDAMAGKFREGKFLGGILTGLKLAGDLLEEHFPKTDDDEDELSNEVHTED